ncbi:MAG: glycoside hydrolase family 16 protein [Bacteroidota bacterium]
MRISVIQISSILFAFFSAFTFSSCEKQEEVAGCRFPSDLGASYSMVWSDEFDGDSVDDSKWSYDLGDGCDISPDLCGWGNNELQYYTDRPENVRVNDGILTMTAKREFPLYLNQHQYTSTRMVTKNKGDWRYGRIDVRARLPIGQGLWPAIWMLPTDNVYGGWPKSGEIDIMEYLGNDPDRVFGTIHYGHDFWRFTSEYFEKDASPNFNDEFHIFSVLWNEDCIQMMVDGEPFGTPFSRSTTLPTTWPFDQNFHLIMNIAVGGNLPGNPDASTQFPQVMEVDYVRVFQEG